MYLLCTAKMFSISVNRVLVCFFWFDDTILCIFSCLRIFAVHRLPKPVDFRKYLVSLNFSTKGPYIMACES